MERYRVFHSLNALRVCAEYCVVHYHVSPLGDGFLKNSAGASALMSFFFVLSGFMAMHTNMDTDFSVPGAKEKYIYRRLQKVYPTYLIWIVLDTPGSVMYWWDLAIRGCPLTWVSLVSQPILLHSWLGSYHAGTTNGVCWYLCTLFWLWFVFPFVIVKAKTHLESRPWTSIVCLYIVSMLCWGLLVPSVHSVNSRQFPPLRLCEFLMGCCVAFTVERPIIHGGWVVLSVSLLFAYWVVTYTQPDLWSMEDAPKGQVCQLWPTMQLQQPLNPTSFLSMFSIVFCLVVHWAAANEQSGKGSSMLQWDCFKTLSTFSLHIYLSHVVVSTFLKFLFEQIGILEWWSTDTLILSCYLIAYMYSTAIEPRLLHWVSSSSETSAINIELEPLHSCISD